MWVVIAVEVQDLIENAISGDRFGDDAGREDAMLAFVVQNV